MTESNPPILVVDDEAPIRQALERALRLEGFGVECASGGREALEAVARRAPAAIILDVTMPDLNGRVVCARLRADGVKTPILILSARDEVEDRIAGLQAGAEQGQEAGEEFQAALTVGDLIVDPSARSVTRGGRELECTRREFELIEVFARNPGIVLERQRLLELVWGYDWVADTNVVDVFVSYLRRKLEENDEPRMIETVRGVGFVLRDPAASDAK